MDIDKILIHPDWETKFEGFDADIAILYFERDVEYSNYIRPVCLPPRDWKSKPLNKGVIAGWGLSENSNSTSPEKLPRKAKINVFPSNEECFFKNEQLLRISSTRTFCGGGENAGPCNGDSGGLIFILNNFIYCEFYFRWRFLCFK